MSEIIKAKNIEELDTDYPLICKDINDILNDINFDNKEEEDKCRFIVENLEENIAENIKKGKAVSLPYVGVLRDNPVIRALKKHHKEFRMARTRMNTKDYTNYTKDVYRYEFKLYKEKELKENEIKSKLDNIRKRNRKLYNKYNIKYGKIYAETYVFCISLIKEIPFNQEIQDKYDEFINRKFNNDR